MAKIRQKIKPELTLLRQLRFYIEQLTQRHDFIIQDIYSPETMTV
jgi:hypothetical protein